jgi:hypothetical protein
MDPSGRMLQMPLSLLEHSPFRNFLIPGIILLVANGLLSFVVLVLALKRRAGYGNWVALQGCVLCGWITVEVILLRTAVWPHYVYWGVALLLFACGMALAREKQAV